MKRILKWKPVRAAAGIVLLVVGLILALPGVPGPGLAIAFGGLVLLSESYPWAKRTVDWLKAKWARYAPKRWTSSREEPKCDPQ